MALCTSSNCVKAMNSDHLETTGTTRCGDLAPETAIAGTDVAAGGEVRPRTLLLVDDEENVIAALKRVFRRSGYRILTADSGQEGLNLLASTDVDVIISDQRMPKMAGTEFLVRAKQLCPESIRIMLSGYTEMQSIVDAINRGSIYKFLTKPWDDEQLRGQIEGAFRQKAACDDSQRLQRELAAANVAQAEWIVRLEGLLAHAPGACCRPDHGGEHERVDPCVHPGAAATGGGARYLDSKVSAGSGLLNK
jgi:CheY-like chemotaxis protein